MNFVILLLFCLSAKINLNRYNIIIFPQREVWLRCNVASFPYQSPIYNIVLGPLGVSSLSVRRRRRCTDSYWPWSQVDSPPRVTTAAPMAFRTHTETCEYNNHKAKTTVLSLPQSTQTIQIQCLLVTYTHF